MSYRFQGQHNNEDVVLFTRQHPLTLLHPMLVTAVILLVPLMAFAVISSNLILAVLLVVCLVLGVLHGAMAFYSWWNSILLLTTERVVYLKQKGLFNREFIECNLQAVLQASHEVKGLLATMFGFGTILIQTPGGGEPFRIANMPAPYDLQQEMLKIAAGDQA